MQSRLVCATDVARSMGDQEGFWRWTRPFAVGRLDRESREYRGDVIGSPRWTRASRPARRTRLQPGHFPDAWGSIARVRCVTSAQSRGAGGVRLDERRSELAHAALFQGLTDAVLLEIARQSSARAVAVGSILPLHDVRIPPLYLIVRGSMRLSLVSATGREFVVTIAGRGDVLGELTEPSSALIATAQEATQLLRIPWSALQRAGAGVELTQRFNAVLAERIQWLLELIEDIALHPLDARLARVLARLHAHSSTHAVMRLHRFNQNTLAQMANATRPKVNQHLQMFQRLGAIELDAGMVTIRDGAVLARIARGASR